MATSTDSTLLRNAQLNARKTSLLNGIIELYSGTPVSTNTSDPGVSACLKITENSGAWTSGVSTNGVSLGTASAEAIGSDGKTYSGVGLAATTATWGRYYNNTKTMWTQGLCATSGAMFNLSTTSITVDGPVTLTSINIHY
jgi:hypothetical protein